MAFGGEVKTRVYVHVYENERGVHTLLIGKPFAFKVILCPRMFSKSVLKKFGDSPPDSSLGCHSPNLSYILNIKTSILCGSLATEGKNIL